jgi:hypothetical protein
MDNTNNRLLVTHQMISEEYKNMTLASGAVNSISTNFSKTNQTYSEYGSKISKSQKLVKDIQRKEYMDNLKLMASFYAFMLSAAYMFLKRFYLHQIVGFAF